jgi:ABC-type cobalamin transport system permease subunit
VKKKRQAAGRYINTDRRLLIAGTALALANSRNLSEMVVRMQLATACLMMGSYMSYS